MKPQLNLALIIPGAVLAAAAVAGIVLAAEAHGKRRQLKRAWLIERRPS